MLFSNSTSKNTKETNLSSQFGENAIDPNQLVAIKGGTPLGILTGWEEGEL